MPRPYRHTATALAALVTALSLGACAAKRPVEPELDYEGIVRGAHLITQQDIVRTGARTAMEAIERSSSHLLIARTREGSPARISQRGIGTLVLGYEILLVVDGSRVSRPEQMLAYLPAESIVYIQILSGREAALQWGSNAGNGVIMVRTAAQ